jgi:hypothetical protein
MQHLKHISEIFTKTLEEHLTPLQKHTQHPNKSLANICVKYMQHPDKQLATYI